MSKLDCTSNQLTPFPILVKVWSDGSLHEWRYMRRSLPSLLESDLPAEARVVFVDDCSPDPRVMPFLSQLSDEYDCVEVRQNPRRLGPNKGHEYNVPKVLEGFPHAPFFVCCDDDVIYHPGWLQRLIQVYHEAKVLNIEGIFTAINTPVRPAIRTVELPTTTVLLKERQMALNWLVPRETYDRVGPFRDTGVAYDTDYANRMAPLGLAVVCLKPSWVQNIGYHGAYQRDDTLTAPDYVGRLDLFLIVRDSYFRIRRCAINTAERIPEGQVKGVLKAVCKPIRSLMRI